MSSALSTKEKGEEKCVKGVVPSMISPTTLHLFNPPYSIIYQPYVTVQSMEVAGTTWYTTVRNGTTTTSSHYTPTPTTGINSNNNSIVIENQVNPNNPFRDIRVKVNRMSMTLFRKVFKVRSIHKYIFKTISNWNTMRYQSMGVGRSSLSISQPNYNSPNIKVKQPSLQVQFEQQMHQLLVDIKNNNYNIPATAAGVTNISSKDKIYHCKYKDWKGVEEMLKYGHFGLLLDKLKNAPHSVHIDDKAIVLACETVSNVNIIKRMYECKSQYFHSIPHLMTKACRGGNLDVVRFLHRKGVPMAGGVIEEAALSGNIELLKYLHKKNCHVPSPGKHWSTVLDIKRLIYNSLQHIDDHVIDYIEKTYTMHTREFTSIYVALVEEIPPKCGVLRSMIKYCRPNPAAVRKYIEVGPFFVILELPFMYWVYGANVVEQVRQSVDTLFTSKYATREQKMLATLFVLSSMKSKRLFEEMMDNGTVFIKFMIKLNANLERDIICLGSVQQAEKVINTLQFNNSSNDLTVYYKLASLRIDKHGSKITSLMRRKYPFLINTFNVQLRLSNNSISANNSNLNNNTQQQQQTDNVQLRLSNNNNLNNNNQQQQIDNTYNIVQNRMSMITI